MPHAKIIITAAVIIVVFIMVSLAQEMSRRWQIQQEIQNLEEQVAELEQSIIELSQLNDYFKTDAFQERLAREKLNYQAPGEQLIVVPDSAVAPTEETQEAEPEYSTPEKWWRLFFADQTG